MVVSRRYGHMAPVAATILLVLSVVAAAAAAWAIERAWTSGWGSVLAVVGGLATLGTSAFVGMMYLDHLWRWGDHRRVAMVRTAQADEERYARFTDRARTVLVFAQDEARLLNHSFVGTEHLLLGLIREGEGVAARALEKLGVSLEIVREKVEETIGPAGTAPAGSPPFTPRSKKVLELSLREALQLGHNYIGTEHILLGLVREGEGVAAQVLVNLGANLSKTRQEVLRLLSGGDSGSASTS
jgi:hypothetical protein